MSDKRYQVFVSSTFTDLVEERQSAIKSILRLSHFPVGMEMFPAADEDAWSLIKGVIDSSDYYLLVVGGRYGSVDDAGMSFTEKEYDYAVQRKKCVIPLLVRDPNAIPRSRTEASDQMWEKLTAFRSKVQKKHHCGFWSNAIELGHEVFVGLTTAIKNHSASGWIPADSSTATLLQSVEALTQKNIELESQLASLKPSTFVDDISDLAQGDEDFELVFKLDEGYAGGTSLRRISATWDRLFKVVGPVMMSEANEREMKLALENSSDRLFTEDGEGEFDSSEFQSISLDDDSFHSVKIQFMALGLIQKVDSGKRKSSQSLMHWKLTPFGERHLTKLVAIRRQKT